MILKLHLSLYAGNNPVWMQDTIVSQKLNHEFTVDELQEAIMVAEDHLISVAKGKKPAAKPAEEKVGGTD